MTARTRVIAALALAIGATGCCSQPRPPAPPTAPAQVDRAAQMVSDLAALRFDRLGDSRLGRVYAPGPLDRSSWARMMLGRLTPRVIVPPGFGGERAGTLYLAARGDRPPEGGAPLAAMVVLPPRRREIDLGALPAAGGARALYSGQGDRLDSSAVLAVDLTHAGAGRLELGFDAWWEIQDGGDLARLETSTDQGKSWIPRLPIDRRLMPAHHDRDSSPGFTGLSGDLDGDGKNESNPACDPPARLPVGEERAGAATSPCLEPSWVKVRVDLSDLRGQVALIRWRYLTDSAVVRRGFLIDNVTVTGLDIPDGDFEGPVEGPWRLAGFTPSATRFDVLVPRYYLLELRIPQLRIPYLGTGPDAITYCRVTAGRVVESGQREYPQLPSGELALPGADFSFELVAPGAGAPVGARAELHFRWADQSR